jgi:hypothetical protein
VSGKAGRVGTYGYKGYKEDFFATGCIAVPTDKKAFAEKLDWTDVGISRTLAKG